jgi:hypothetical protein
MGPNGGVNANLVRPIIDKLISPSWKDGVDVVDLQVRCMDITTLVNRGRSLYCLIYRAILDTCVGSC